MDYFLWHVTLKKNNNNWMAELSVLLSTVTAQCFDCDSALVAAPHQGLKKQQGHKKEIS